MRELIHRLTRDHYRDGHIRVSLLAELQGETMPGRNSSSGPTDELKIPIAAGTIDLYRRISEKAYDDLWKWKRCLCAGTLEDVIQCFGYAEPDNDEYFENLLQSWVDSIENLLRPKKPRRKIHAPCPNCGTKYHGPEREPAVTANCWDEQENMLHPGLWDVACDACGASWSGDKLPFLTSALSA